MTADDRKRRGSRLRAAARYIVGAVLILACAFAGGLALGSIWGSAKENDDYRVMTQVIPRSQVELPTTIGTATFDTHAWGPGGRATVTALALPPVDRRWGGPFIDLDRQLDEITDMTVDAARKSLWKFVAGAAAGGLLGAWAWRGIAGRRRSRRAWITSTVVGLTASLVVTAAWGAGAYLTFDEEYGRNIQADGLLAVGLSSRELLDELNARDQQYAGWVQSLSTYISRLRETATPPEEQSVAVRALLISDVHSRNVYPQLAEIVESQDIDLIIDGGDLVDWGTGFELGARPDLRRDIAALDVPYVFVKGNHDGPATIETLTEIPNVVILDGEVEEIAGLNVIGAPDPRLFQDGGPIESREPEEVERMEQEAASELAESLGEDVGPVDFVVMHHPAAARELGEQLSAPIWMSGHTHKPDMTIGDDWLDITVGTTGAAGIRTFYAQDEEGDVVATQQSFDILDFDSACRPMSLTRFTYPDSLSYVGNAQVSYQTLSIGDDEEDEDEEAEEEDGDSGTVERTCG